MRTAGKRPKALLARRIRPRDSRFVPSLTDRPPQSRQMPPRPVPLAIPPASIQAACGDFQEPLPATPVCCRYKKNIFQPALAKNLSRHAPAIPRPARATHARQRPPFFPNRQDPADTATSRRVALPAFSLYRRAGRIPPVPPAIHTTARITPGHRCQRQVCSKKRPSSAASEPQAQRHRYQGGRPRRTRGPSCPKTPAARTLPSRRPEQKFSRGWGYGGRGAFSKRRPFPRNSPIFPSHDTGRTFPSLPGSAVPGPLPSRPGLGKDAANKRRWRD